MFPGGPPPDAGLVLVQVKEADQSFLLPLHFGHLSAGLHGAHTPLHYRGARGVKLVRKSRETIILSVIYCQHQSWFVQINNSVYCIFSTL